MVKYLLVAVTLVASLAVTDAAMARGRRGCSTCNVGGGCPGGVCALPAAPAKMAVSNVPPGAVAESAPAAPSASDVAAPTAAAPVATAPATRTYVNTARRGIFGRR